jgi:glycosyltransferase involved in cell wall biosynthesis
MTAPRVALVGSNDVDGRLELMRRLRDDFEMEAVGSAPELTERFHAEGFAYHCYPLGQARVSPLDDLRAVAALVEIFRRRRPDVVHAFDTKAAVWGCLAARLAGVPVGVGTVNGLGFLYGSRRTSVRLAWWVYQVLQALACRASAATIFQNGEDARLFAARRIVPSDRARIILGSGVDTERFHPERIAESERRRVREELGLRAGEIVVTMVSRVIRTKGVLELAAAARAIRAERPDVRFVLIGPLETDSMDRLDAAEIGELRASLTWPGARRDVPAVLAVSDVVALPTAYREGLPRVLLEAGAMGLPLVATDSPGCNEVVQDGENGFLTPVGDAAALTRALRLLIGDAELRQRFGAEARRRVVKEFDLALISAAHRDLYHELLRRRRRATRRQEER